jgi:hypothetical protein
MPSPGGLAGLGIARSASRRRPGWSRSWPARLFFRIRVHDAIPFLLGDAAILVLACVAAALRTVTT